MSQSHSSSAVSGLRKACDRCHAQKLSCPREGSALSECTRCRKAGVPCSTSASLRNKRPKHQHGLSHARHGPADPKSDHEREDEPDEDGQKRTEGCSGEQTQMFSPSNPIERPVSDHQARIQHPDLIFGADFSWVDHFDDDLLPMQSASFDADGAPESDFMNLIGAPLQHPPDPLGISDVQTTSRTSNGESAVMPLATELISENLEHYPNQHFSPSRSRGVSTHSPGQNSVNPLQQPQDALQAARLGQSKAQKLRTVARIIIELYTLTAGLSIDHGEGDPFGPFTAGLQQTGKQAFEDVLKLAFDFLQILRDLGYERPYASSSSTHEQFPQDDTRSRVYPSMRQDVPPTSSSSSSLPSLSQGASESGQALLMASCHVHLLEAFVAVLDLTISNLTHFQRNGTTATLPLDAIGFPTVCVGAVSMDHHPRLKVLLSLELIEHMILNLGALNGPLGIGDHRSLGINTCGGREGSGAIGQNSRVAYHRTTPSQSPPDLTQRSVLLQEDRVLTLIRHLRTLVSTSEGLFL